MVNNENRFKQDIDYRTYRIKHFGKKHGWKIIGETPLFLEFGIVHIYGTPKVILKINYITFEIETILNHPKRGVTRLMRQGEFNMKLIEKIFIDPRAHMPDRIKGQYANKVPPPKP